MTSNTAFPLGAYFGGPNGNDPVANAAFEQTFNTFVATMGGAKLAYMDTYTDFNSDPSLWASNAGWTAWSWAQTGSSYVGPGSGVVPVIGVPLASSAGGWSNVDTFFKAIIAGNYDADYKGIVDAWSVQGYKTMQMRIGYEFNDNNMPWSPGNSTSPTANADFVAAWQHVANLLHAEGIADGVTVQTVWNPSVTTVEPTPAATLYPGDQYVDIIGADLYSAIYPNDLANWSTGGTTQVANVATFSATPANQEHIWTYEDSTQASPGGSGWGWTMQQTIAFAAAHGKPLSMSETGAGGDGGGQGPVDNAAFPQWLATVLAQAQASGVTVQNVDIWSMDLAEGRTNFLNGEKPAEAAAWSKYFGAGSTAAAALPTITLSAPGSVQEASPGAGVTVTETITTTNLIGAVYEEVLTASGAVETPYAVVALTNGVASTSVHLANSGDTIRVYDNLTTLPVMATSAPVTITDQVKPPPTISLSAPGTVQEASVGAGVTITETITTTNLSGTVFEAVLTASGAVETAFAPVTITNGTASSSVHLAKSGDTIRVVYNATTPTVIATSAPVTITDPSTTSVTIGSGPDTLALLVSEDAWKGDAQYTVSIDGKQIGGTQTATASHAAGQTATLNVLGNFAAGKHTATVNFLNDAWGGTAATDRNLYVTGASIDSTVVPAVTLNEYNQGAKSFSFLAPGHASAAPTIDVVNVNHPATLSAGVQSVTGTESDASQSIFLDWRTTGTPVIGDSDWVQANVTAGGQFSASVNIDHAGTQSTMFYRIGSGATVAAWSATPS